MSLQRGWMWLTESEWKSDEEPRFVYFRGKLQIESVPKECLVQITADSRYKLYINGQFVEMGPSRGNNKIWYVDTIDIVPYLHEGENVLAIIVLRYPYTHWKGNCGIFRTENPGLYVYCDFSVEWKCCLANHIQIISENPWFAPLMIYEEVVSDDAFANWMSGSYDDRKWQEPKCYTKEELPEVLRIEKLVPRTIPFLYRKAKQFVRTCGKGKDESWDLFLAGHEKIQIAANSVVSVEVDAGELMTGYLQLRMAKGTRARISILQSECYAGEIIENPDPFKSMPKKGNRTDESLTLYGYTDTYEAAGYGNEERAEVYEPFWFRTFRYIRLTIETGDEPLDLLGFDYEETGYPLDVVTKVQVSDATLSSIWEISERSLRRCMHETYEDCPFYEQLQYAMDTRSQILYTYAISGDERLAIKAIDDFSHAMREDGMINCSYPNFETNVIPGFATYYIGMIYDYMMYFGNGEYIAGHMEAIQGILDFFERNLDERGIVGKVGDLNRPGNYWSFIDWTPEWDETNGVPACTLQGPITMESLLYVLGLQYAAEIADYLGKAEIANKYRTKAQSLQCSIRQFCLGSNGMYQDGPGIDTYSQHCQVFAILTDTVSKEEGRKLLLETLNNKENYAQCSIAMMFYLFRALEKCDLYEYTDRLWDIWREMVRNNMTTCGEDSLMSRSDCHAWGALALYELPAVVLGVRPAKPGYEEILVKPQMGRFQWAKGEVITPKGKVQVAWKKETDGTMSIDVHGPENVCTKIDKGDESE